MVFNLTGRCLRSRVAVLKPVVAVEDPELSVVLFENLLFVEKTEADRMQKVAGTVRSSGW